MFRKLASSDMAWFALSAAILGPPFLKLTEREPLHKPKPIVTVEKPKNRELLHQPVKIPVKNLTVSPPNVQYVLVGSGTASYAALEAIKKADPNADVLIIGEESFTPYMRPPLSKELWHSTHARPYSFKDFMGRDTELFYLPLESFHVLNSSAELADYSSLPSSKVKIMLNTRVKKLNVNDQWVELENGQKIHYAKVLIATGGKPNSMPFAKDLANVTTFRNLSHFESLKKKLESPGEKTIAIVGGGFLGSELAVAIAKKGAETGTKVVQVFPEDGNLGLVLPRYLSEWTTSKVREEGVIVKPKTQVSSASVIEDRVQLNLSNGETVEANHVIVAAGITPDLEFAKQSQLEIDEKRNGILVNAELEARSNVFAAGDAASFHDVYLGRRRIEHYDHAIMSGQQAGLNMVGPKRPYTHLSMFWSDIGPNVSFEAVGITDAKFPTVSVWAKEPGSEKEDLNKGVVFYMSPEEKKIVGVLMWNLHGKVDMARSIIKEGKTYEDATQLAGLFNVNKD